MEESKLPQRKYKYVRRTAVFALVVLILLCTSIVLILNSIPTQQYLFKTYVAPVLADYELEIDFEGMHYLFPSTVVVPGMEIAYQGKPLARTGELSFQEFVWEDRLEGRKVLLDELQIVRPVDSALLADLNQSFGTDDSAATTEFTLPFSMLIGDIEVQNISIELFGNEVLSSIVFKNLTADRDLFVDRTTFDVVFNNESVRLELDTLNYGLLSKVFSSHVQVTYDGLGAVDGHVQYQADSIASTGKIVTVQRPEAQFLKDTPWNAYLSNAVLEYQLTSVNDLLLFEYSILSPDIEGFGHAEYITSTTSLDLYSDFYPAPGLFSTELLSAYEKVWDVVNPEEIGVTLRTDLEDRFEFEFKLIDGANSLKISADKFSQPARLTAHLPELDLGPLKGVQLKTALVPSINAVLNNEPFELRGVMPTIWMEETSVKGLSFSYRHARNDSIWLSCLDPNFDIDGHLTLEDQQITSKIQLNSAGLYLFDALDTGQVLSGELSTHFNLEGEGTFALKNVLLQRPNDVVFLRNVEFRHEKDAQQREVSIQSDVLNASITGTWDFENLSGIGQQVIQHVIAQETMPWQPAKIDFQLDAGNISWITDLLHFDAQLSEESHIYGQYNGPKERWSLTVDIPELKIEGVESNRLHINSYHYNKTHKTVASLGLLGYEGYVLDTLHVNISGDGVQRTISSNLTLRDSIPTELQLHADFGPGRWKFNQGEFNVGNAQFEFLPNGTLVWAGEELQVNTLGFEGKDGRIVANGKLLNNGNDVLRLKLEHIDSKVLNYVLRIPDLELGGQFGGTVNIKNTLSAPEIYSEFTCTDFGLNGYTYGRLNAGLRYQKDGDVFAQGFLRNKGTALMNFGGHYDAQSTDLDVRIGLDQLEISPLNPLLGGVLDQLEGRLQGGVSVYGPVDDWSIGGSFALSKGHFTVPVIGAELATMEDAEITISNDKITLDSTTFYVPNDSTTAVAWGAIYHDRFDQIVFDLRFHTDSMRAVDMDRAIDGYFYGTAIAAGDMVLEGPLEQLHLDLALATKDGTNFKIPLDNPTAVETPNFLRFVTLEANDTLKTTKKQLEYFTTDMAIEATKAAKLELVLDEVLGDVIKAQGSGNLRLKLLDDESMELFGLYTVSSGSYLFTLQNIINKPFTLIPGGTILWSGDLYEADVQLEAKYSLSTDLEGLVSSASYNNENVDVDLIVELSGALMSPEISFRVELPESPSSHLEELERHFLTDDAMNYQAFSLLLLGEFFKQDLGIQENIHLGTSVSKTTSELLVSEFGSWLAAGIGSYVDIELDYTSGANPYNSLETTGDQLNLGVSKDFFEGRLRVNSSLDIPIAQGGTSTLMLGDTEVAYSLTKDGRIVLRAFNRSNRNDPLLQSSGPYTQGVGILFQKEFERVTKKDSSSSKQ